jgi:hypothetical protein
MSIIGGHAQDNIARVGRLGKSYIILFLEPPKVILKIIIDA